MGLDRGLISHSTKIIVFCLLNAHKSDRNTSRNVIGILYACVHKGKTHEKSEGQFAKQATVPSLLLYCQHKGVYAGAAGHTPRSIELVTNQA